jgi:rhamnulokinase
MKSSRHVAFDFGAESGRTILGKLDSGRLEIREVNRFPNGMKEVDGSLHWETPRLFGEITRGLVAAGSEGTPDSLGVDTWAVDFALLDADGNPLGLPFAYRDRRNNGAMDSFFRKMPPERLYSLTGIQFLQFNTVFQLESMVRDHSPLLEKAKDLLFIPDLFHYLFTGVKKCEFSFATTSALFNPVSQKWDPEIFRALGISPAIMQEVAQPGTVLAPLGESFRKVTGLQPIPVALVATHDTGSAVAAAPGEGGDWAYLSSGTWSLLGIESKKPLITEETRKMNFTNEGGIGGTYRVLKNIMGLWLLQECRRSWASAGKEFTYPKIAEMASTTPAFVSLVDPDHAGFLNPPDMPDAIRKYCATTGQPVPESPAAVARCVFESLALKYRFVIDQLRKISPNPINRLHVFGGGCNNKLLAQFTANACGIPVHAGPAEATAIGNILVQAMALGFVKSHSELRTIVRNSFPLDKYEPQETEKWEKAYGKFKELAGR